MGLLDKLPSDVKLQIMKDVSNLFLQNKSFIPEFEIVDMKQYFTSRKLPPETNEYGEILPGIPSAFYSFADGIMGFDKNAFQNDFLKTLLSVAHETTHVNQYIQWVTGDDKERRGILQDRKIPPELQPFVQKNTPENNRKIQEYLPDDLNHFWTKTYGYDKNPYEIEANKVARNNIKNILQFAYKKAEEYLKKQQTTSQTA